jgi:quercetin dioxygenase-like cupin family protein
MAESYTVLHWDDFEEMEGSGNATWRLARKSLGAEAFGFNVVDIEAGGQIPEHSHADEPEEEVYVTLEGDATFVAGDEEIPAPPGTFIRYAPETRRGIRNHSDARVRALVIGVPMDSGYEPMSWG